MMKNRLATPILFTGFMAVYLKSHAEGQGGMGTFFLIVYLLTLIFYTVVNMILIKIFWRLFRPKQRLSRTTLVFIAFVAAIVILLLGGDAVVPLFWAT